MLYNGDCRVLYFLARPTEAVLFNKFGVQVRPPLHVVAPLFCRRLRINLALGQCLSDGRVELVQKKSEEGSISNRCMEHLMLSYISVAGIFQ
jgi:hypothetical protein